MCPELLWYHLKNQAQDMNHKDFVNRNNKKKQNLFF
jgi:hypothetical protein